MTVRCPINDPSADRSVDVLGRDIFQKFFCLSSITHSNQGNVGHGEHSHNTVRFIHDGACLLARPVHELNRLVDRLVRHNRGRFVNLDL